MNALIDGRPRRNDPFVGRGPRAAIASPGNCLFNSIHTGPVDLFVSAGIRRLGINCLHRTGGDGGTTGELLSVFWLLNSLTRDARFAGWCRCLDSVLCFGALAAGEGLVGVLLNR